MSRRQPILHDDKADRRTRPDDMAEQSLPVPISIVSNSCLLREGLPGLLASHLSVEIMGSYGAEPLPTDTSFSLARHIVLLDSGIGSNLATAWTRYWRSISPPAAVVVLELANDSSAILNCIEAGAVGYTLQGADVAEVAATIRRVQEGTVLCTPQVTAQLFARLAEPRLPPGPPALLVRLTPRELEVLRCIARDYSNQEIADALVIEVRTVKHHVHNILEKLKLRHRWDAARVAVEQGWIEVG